MSETKIDIRVQYFSDGDFLKIAVYDSQSLTTIGEYTSSCDYLTEKQLAEKITECIGHAVASYIVKFRYTENE